MRFLIVQDYKENRRKCTLAALEGVPGFTFVRLEHPRRSEKVVEIGEGILLHVDGPCLGPDDRELASKQVVVLDSTWARVPNVLRRVRVHREALLARRSLPSEVVTAYPRVSKLYDDPSTGLASIEAVFAVTAILGEPRPELLEGYRWAPDFLRRNSSFFQKFGS